jgi:hypothetical protein
MHFMIMMEYWSDDAPTSTVFTIGSDGLVNTNTQNYIAYVFAPVKGYSKFGKLHRKWKC